MCNSGSYFEECAYVLSDFSENNASLANDTDTRRTMLHERCIPQWHARPTNNNNNNIKPLPVRAWKPAAATACSAAAAADCAASSAVGPPTAMAVA